MEKGADAQTLSAEISENCGNFQIVNDYCQTGLHKTGIRGIQDTRQIVDGKTNDIENNDKKRWVQTLNIRQLMKKAI